LAGAWFVPAWFSFVKMPAVDPGVRKPENPGSDVPLRKNMDFRAPV
jgi:hypothetical protein